MVTQLWQRATSTYLQPKKQKNATSFTQWQDIRNHSQKDESLYDEPPRKTEYWLPSYQDAVAEPLLAIVDHARSYK